MKIESFTGDYRFLSNFHPSPMAIDGGIYPTVEHAFQAMKTDVPTERELVRNAKTPGQAKELGRKVTLRPTWNEERVDVMRKLVRKKFEGKQILKELLATGDAELVETNDWNDRFWGVCGGVGENWLGKILMEVRSDLRSSPKTVVTEGTFGDIDHDIGPSVWVNVTLANGSTWNADLDNFPISSEEIRKLKGRSFRLTTTFELK